MRRRGFVAALGVVCAVTFSLPALAAGAEEESAGGSAVFKLKGSNGYEIVVLGLSSYEIPAQVLVLVTGKHGGASYVTKDAVVTATRLKADFGRVGRIAVDVVPSGRKRSFRIPCRDRPITYEPVRYRGTIEFHGEENYTDVAVSSVPDDLPYLARGECEFDNSGEEAGDDSEAALLKAESKSGVGTLRIEARKGGPGEGTSIAAEVGERHGQLRISRYLAIKVGPGAFEYDRKLRTATVSPPAPFSGSATYHRTAAVANRWTGDLEADFPGHSDVRLVGRRVRVKLVHSLFLSSEFEHAGRR